MSARLLAVVRPRQESLARQALAVLVATARAERAHIRLACFEPLPPPRVDRRDRVVADAEREMARIAAGLVARFTAATRVYDDVAVECVVRFGTPRREVRLEIEAYAPDLIAHFERRRGPSIRVRPHAGSAADALTAAHRARPAVR